MSLRTYLENKSRKSGPLYVMGAPISIVTPMVHDIDMSTVSDQLSSMVPGFDLSGFIDGVYIGDFEILREREIEAMFAEDAIYLAHDVTPDEIATHLLHEISHIIEKEAFDVIYGDGSVEMEFLNKRSILRSRLDKYDISNHEWFQTGFSKRLDDLFLNVIGYDGMKLVAGDLFIDPYAASSLSEYYATGFENFFSKTNPDVLNSICPVLYSTLVELKSFLTGIGNDRRTEIPHP